MKAGRAVAPAATRKRTGLPAHQIEEDDIRSLLPASGLHPWLEWRTGQGVYLRSAILDAEVDHLLSGDLTGVDVRNEMLAHPTGNLSEPVLPFPCTPVQFRAFLRLPLAKASPAVYHWRQAPIEQAEAFYGDRPKAGGLLRQIRGDNTTKTGASKQELYLLAAKMRREFQEAGEAKSTQRVIAWFVEHYSITLQPKTAQDWMSKGEVLFEAGAGGRQVAVAAGEPTPQGTLEGAVFRMAKRMRAKR